LFNALKTGEATPTTVEKLRAAFEPFLGDPLAVDDLGKQLTPHRLNTIVRTNSTEAFNEGLKHSLDQEVADGDIIGWEYSAILDGRQTDICEHLDELIFKPDSPSLQAMTPPNHFNCRSVLIPVPVEEAPVRFITEEEVGKAEDLKGDEF
jgi:SPP1 gp7 family putative phage head morphogenesis protein